MTLATMLIAPHQFCPRCLEARESTRISGRGGYRNVKAPHRARYRIDGEDLCATHAQQKALAILLKDELHFT
jgi:hypothetical protein